MRVFIVSYSTASVGFPKFGPGTGHGGYTGVNHGNPDTLVAHSFVELRAVHTDTEVLLDVHTEESGRDVSIFIETELKKLVSEQSSDGPSGTR